MPFSAEPCPCCCKTDWHEIGKKRGEFIPQEYTYLRCGSCRYVRVVPFAGYGIYDDDYYSGRGADPYVNYQSEYENFLGTDRVFEFEDLYRIAGEFFSRASRPPAEAIRWLDFGCGAGGLLKYLRFRDGLAVGGRRVPLVLSGHDVGAHADKLARDDGFSIHSQPQLEALPDRSFDVISLVEVIEHIPTPDAVIKLCARLLRPGGLLLLTTGNFDCPVARRQGVNYRYCIPEIHVSLFSPASLAALYRRHGLDPWPVRYRGCIKFKVLKSVSPRRRRWASGLLRLPGILPLIDVAYGVSLMPCARSPG